MVFLLNLLYSYVHVYDTAVVRVPRYHLEPLLEITGADVVRFFIKNIKPATHGEKTRRRLGRQTKISSTAVP